MPCTPGEEGQLSALNNHDMKGREGWKRSLPFSLEHISL